MEPLIMVVDDEEPIRRLVSRSLRSHPYRLIESGDGEEALRLGKCHNPDLILLDIGLPIMNGLDVLRQLRKEAATRLVPVIMLTGAAGVDDMVSGLELGADDYITKPFVVSELLARIGSLLRRDSAGVAANPLTRLPGGPTIEEEVGKRIGAGEPFAFFHIDIDRFKSFNDRYGFARGDEVIRKTGSLISEIVRSEGGAQDFIGHIGGDDFVLVCRPDAAPDLAQAIAARFDAIASGFYDPADREEGFVETHDRQGQLSRSRVMTLSMGVVSNLTQTLGHYGRVAALAAEMKELCKKDASRTMSRFAFDRRRG